MEYHGRIKPLYGAWEPVAESIRNSATTFEAVPSIAVPLSVAVILDKLIDDDKYVEGKIKHQFLRMCIAVNNETIKWSGNETLAQQWKDLQTHDMAHLGKKPDVDRAIAKFRELEQIAFNVFNHGADRERRNLELIAGLTPENLKSVILKMVTLNDHITFYTELKRADVLLGLEQLGKFKFVDDSITIWPPAIYLKNVAEEDPTNVSRILISLKASEPGIVNQLLLATLELPKQDLVRIANNATWLEAEPHWRFFDGYVKLIERLVEPGKSKLIFKMAARLFRLKRVRTKTFNGLEVLEAEPAIGDDWLLAVIERVVPVLHPVDHDMTVSLLADCLDEILAIESEGYNLSGYTGWYQNLLDADDGKHGTKGQLTKALLAEVDLIADADLNRALLFLEQRKSGSSIYQRIEYAILLKHGSSEAILPHLLEAEEWKDSEPEFVALLERTFPNLSNDQRLAVTTVGFETLRTYLEPYIRRDEDSDEKVEKYLLAQTARRFGATIELLPEPYRSKMLSVTAGAEVLQPPVSPTLGELEALTPILVVREFEKTAPSEQDPEGGQYGMGGFLRVLLEQHGDDWLTQQDAVKQIPLYYLGWAINGLQGYRRNLQQSDDERLLAATEGFLDRVEAALSRAGSISLDVANHIAQQAGILLSDIARNTQSAHFIARIVTGARRLAAIPPDDKRRHPVTPASAPNDALGNPKGLATQIVGDALITANRINSDKSAIIEFFDELTQDDSLIVRAACGRLFSWFTTIRPEQAGDWAQRLFLSENEDANRAAWNGFVTSSDVYQSTYKLLREAYVRRVNDLGTLTETDATERAKRSSSERIPETRTLWHIWVLLANRIEKVGEPGSLAELMLDNVPPSLLAESLAEIAPSLAISTDPESRHHMVNEEATRLWAAVEKRVASGHFPKTVLSSLPLWLRAPLPAEWRFEKAEALLSPDTVNAKNDWVLVKAIVDLAKENRERALALMLRLAQTLSPGALTGIQMDGSDLIREGAQGNESERYCAEQINSIIMSNHRPNMLSNFEPPPDGAHCEPT